MLRSPGSDQGHFGQILIHAPQVRDKDASASSTLVTVRIILHPHAVFWSAPLRRTDATSLC